MNNTDLCAKLKRLKDLIIYLILSVSWLITVGVKCTLGFPHTLEHSVLRNGQGVFSLFNNYLQ